MQVTLDLTDLGAEYTAGLLRRVAQEGSGAYTLAAVAAQIEAQLPKKPEEPTGLGAVVEDAEGVRWVRYAETALAWMHWRSEERDVVAKWSGIDAVRVLSEGVTL